MTWERKYISIMTQPRVINTPCTRYHMKHHETRGEHFHRDFYWCEPTEIFECYSREKKSALNRTHFPGNSCPVCTACMDNFYSPLINFSCSENHMAQPLEICAFDLASNLVPQFYCTEYLECCASAQLYRPPQNLSSQLHTVKMTRKVEIAVLCLLCNMSSILILPITYYIHYLVIVAQVMFSSHSHQLGSFQSLQDH